MKLSVSKTNYHLIINNKKGDYDYQLLFNNIITELKNIINKDKMNEKVNNNELVFTDEIQLNIFGPYNAHPRPKVIELLIKNTLGKDIRYKLTHKVLY